VTPAERARQIDREEFAAECAAVRQRAYARFKIKPQPDKRVREWIQRQEPKGTIKPNYTVPPKGARKVSRPYAPDAKLYTAFGHTRTLTGWAAETGMSRNTIRSRLSYGWTLEDALTRSVQAHKPSNRETVPEYPQSATSSLSPLPVAADEAVQSHRLPARRVTGQFPSPSSPTRAPCREC
jgi:hypothetical protein